MILVYITFGLDHKSVFPFTQIVSYNILYIIKNNSINIRFSIYQVTILFSIYNVWYLVITI